MKTGNRQRKIEPKRKRSPSKKEDRQFVRLLPQGTTLTPCGGGHRVTHNKPSSQYD